MHHSPKGCHLANHRLYRLKRYLEGRAARSGGQCTSPTCYCRLWHRCQQSTDDHRCGRHCIDSVSTIQCKIHCDQWQMLSSISLLVLLDCQNQINVIFMQNKTRMLSRRKRRGKKRGTSISPNFEVGWIPSMKGKKVENLLELKGLNGLQMV